MFKLNCIKKLFNINVYKKNEDDKNYIFKNKYMFLMFIGSCNT